VIEGQTQDPTGRPVVVIVDGYVSGRHLASELRDAGADVVHLRSSREWLPAQTRPDLTPYAMFDVFDGLEPTIARLSLLRPVGVLAGMEPGVELADLLAERLALPGNGTRRSSARRDKFEMIETVRDAGLRAARQLCGSEEGDLLDWAKDELSRGPVVVKPRRSAGADGVFICTDLTQVRAAARQLLVGRTVYDEPNLDVLLQEYIEGDEYVVDMVSGNGGRYLCGVWKYHRRLLPDGRVLLDGDELVDETSPETSAMADYVEKVLDALEVEIGPSHAEVKMTSEGPVLIEVGTRVSGNLHPRFHDRVTGSNQATASAVSLLQPAVFGQRFARRTYLRRCPAFCCTTSTAHDGIVVGIDEDALDAIREIPAVFHVDLKRIPGDRITPTVDLSTSSMRIFLEAESLEEIAVARCEIDQRREAVFLVEPLGYRGGQR
jgi:hypothetical protein